MSEPRYRIYYKVPEYEKDRLIPFDPSKPPCLWHLEDMKSGITFSFPDFHIAQAYLELLISEKKRPKEFFFDDQGFMIVKD